jgi:hypothetical protein
VEAVREPRRLFFFFKESVISDSKSKKSATRTAEGVFEVWERRSQLVKNELAAANAATDAKTARLRALRLAKEAEDAEAARIAAENAPPAPAKKRAKRSS